MSDYSDDDVSDVSEHEEEQSKAKAKRGRQVEEPEEVLFGCPPGLTQGRQGYVLRELLC